MTITECWDHNWEGRGVCPDCKRKTEGERINRMIGVECITFGMEDRCYGGPEEGGWYYTHVEPIRYFYVPTTKAFKFLQRLEAFVARKNIGRRPISSVLSEGRYFVAAGYEERTQKPRYE